MFNVKHIRVCDDASNIGGDSGGGKSLGVDPTNLFGDVVADFKGTNGSFVDV